MKKKRAYKQLLDLPPPFFYLTFSGRHQALACTDREVRAGTSGMNAPASERRELLQPMKAALQTKPSPTNI